MRSPFHERPSSSCSDVLSDQRSLPATTVLTPVSTVWRPCVSNALAPDVAKRKRPSWNAHIGLSRRRWEVSLPSMGAEDVRDAPIR